MPSCTKILVRLCWWFWWWCTLGILFQVGGRVRCKVAACDGYPSSVRRLISSFRKSPVCRSEIIQGRHCTSKDKELKTRIVLSQLVSWTHNLYGVAPSVECCSCWCWRCSQLILFYALSPTQASSVDVTLSSFSADYKSENQLIKYYPLRTKVNISWLNPIHCHRPG